MLHGLAPIHLTDPQHCFAPSQALRLAGQSLLVVPTSRRKLRGHRAFSVVVPRLWNPLHIRQPDSLSVSSLPKTHFFSLAF